MSVIDAINPMKTKVLGHLMFPYDPLRICPNFSFISIEKLLNELFFLLSKIFIFTK